MYGYEAEKKGSIPTPFQPLVRASPFFLLLSFLEAHFIFFMLVVMMLAAEHIHSPREVVSANIEILIELNDSKRMTNIQSIYMRYDMIILHQTRTHMLR